MKKKHVERDGLEHHMSGICSGEVFELDDVVALLVEEEEGLAEK